MVAPFIALQIQTGTPQMVRYAASNASLVGNSFGTADSGLSTSTNSVMPIGRVIRFGGLNTYLAAVGTAIYRTTDGGTTWTSVLTLPSINARDHRKSGFAVVYLNGLPAVCLIYSDTSNTNIRGVFSFDGVTWTTQGPFSVTAVGATAVMGFNEVVVQGGTMFVQCGSGGGGGGAGTDQLYVYTPGANQLTGVTPTGLGSSNISPAICLFNNRLFVLYVRTAATSTTISEIVGTTSTIITTLQTGGPVTTNGICSLFVDGANMFAFVTGSDGAGSNTGFRVWRISSALVATEITTTVLPLILRTAFPLEGGLAAARVRAYIDGITSPGSSPTIYLYISTISNSSWSVYRWNGDATEISLISQGGSTLHSLPMFENVTGTYSVSDTVFPSTVGISVEITNRIFTASGVRLSFKIFGTTAGGAASFRIYVGDENSEYPTTAGTLTDPSVGAISGGTINTGLTGDNGATTYQVTWAAQTDGFTVNSAFRLVGDAFV